jgi:hypothetical protein
VSERTVRAADVRPGDRLAYRATVVTPDGVETIDGPAVTDVEYLPDGTVRIISASWWGEAWKDHQPDDPVYLRTET